MGLKNLIRRFTSAFLINWYHFLLVFFAAFWYRFPSQKMKVVGVTGTNGKSTVVDLITIILGEAGFKVASLSSIRFKIGEKEWQNDLKMTMPGRFKIQKFLRQAKDSGCQYVVLEVTSEGIKQHRHRFINFETAVFTNLSPEHIEAHGGFENYKKTKGKLFQATKGMHVINLDDEHAEYFLQFPAEEKYFYKVKMQNAKIKMKNQNAKLIEAQDCQMFPQGLRFFIDNAEFNLRLLGKFNIYNALAAICVGLSQGVDLQTCKSALEKVKVIPGRMEQVISKPFKVFVDYAFTPNALEKVYKILTTNNFKLKTARMICVLGACGGGRDKWKRPVLGKIAAQYCDSVIITNEDPYEEDPMEIIEQVAKGAGKKAKKILERREAIRESLKLAMPGDIVVITGKGCEPWICLANGKKIPWDDRRVVKEEFNKIKK